MLYLSVRKPEEIKKLTIWEGQSRRQSNSKQAKPWVTIGKAAASHMGVPVWAQDPSLAPRRKRACDLKELTSPSRGHSLEGRPPTDGEPKEAV